MTGVNADDMSRLEPLAIDVPCSCGDLLLFSNVVIHRGGVNSTDSARWSADWRFQDSAKPTYREENGHVVWSEDASDSSVVRTPAQWAALDLS